MWKPPRNRVSKTQFLIGVFFKFNALCLSILTYPLTLSASPVRPSPSLSLTDPDPLTLSASPVGHSHSLNLTDPDPNPLLLTLSLSHSPTHCHNSLSHPHTDTPSPSLLSHSVSSLQSRSSQSFGFL